MGAYYIMQNYRINRIKRKLSSILMQIMSKLFYAWTMYESTLEWIFLFIFLLSVYVY